MNKFLVFICVCYLTLNTIVLYSQEVQVPMDADGKVSFIDSVMNNKIEVFDTYPGFIEARLFQLTDSTFSMEIYYMIDDKFNRHRMNMTRAEVDSLRLEVSRKLKDTQSTTIDQNGRAELLWGLTIAGLSTYGPGTVIMTGADNSVAIGLYMLSSAASFLIPYALTDNAPVSDGAARFSLWGAASGVGHGWFFYELFDLDQPINDPYGYSYNATDEKALWGLMTFTSMAEAYIGYRIAQDFHFSAGKSDMMINTSIAATATLPALLYIGGVKDKKALFGSAILGTFGGYALGNYITNTQNYSRGDAMCFSNVWVLGAAVPVSILIAAESENEKAYMGLAILGAGLGMGVGNYLVKGKDFSTSQGVYMTLGSFGGAFVAGGLAFLAAGDSDNWQIIPPVISLGAVGGFALTYLAFADNPKIQEKNLSGDLKVDFNPMALTTAFSKGNEYSPLNYYSPFLSVTYKF